MLETLQLRKGKLESKKGLASPKGAKLQWIDVTAPTKEDLELLKKKFKFHPLALEDASNERQAAKVEHYDRYHFIVIHSLGFEQAQEISELKATQLSIFLGKNFLVSIHSKRVKEVDDVKDRVKKDPRLLSRGADFLAYLLLDAVVDEMFPLVDILEDQIDKVEEGILRKHSIPTRQVLNELFLLKKRLLHLRKVVGPQRDTLNILASRELPYVKGETRAYFRDVYDHLLRVTSFLDHYRELISSATESYLTVVSNNLSTVMKKLTAITAIVMVPTLIAGIYGMNFAFMPELKEEFGYYGALASMLATMVLLAIYFRQKEWV